MLSKRPWVEQDTDFPLPAPKWINPGLPCVRDTCVSYSLVGLKAFKFSVKKTKQNLKTQVRCDLRYNPSAWRQEDCESVSKVRV